MYLAIQKLNQIILYKITKFLIDIGVNIFIRNFNGETILHIAVKKSNINAVEKLFCANNFGNIYLGVKDNSGKSAKKYIE
jgi:ankyrin repeat protein